MSNEVRNSKLCDQLGNLEAQIAGLKKQADAIKKELISRGAGAYEGALFRSVVTIGESSRLNMDAVREKLSPQFISANTVLVPFEKVCTKARNNIAVAA